MRPCYFAIRQHAQHHEEYTDCVADSRKTGIFLTMWRAIAAGVLLTVACTCLSAATTPIPPFAGADTFMRQNCAVCHSSPTGPGRLDLTKLSFEPSNPEYFAVWVKVHDRVAAGEMPPAEMPRPAAATLTQFVNGLDTALTSWE